MISLKSSVILFLFGLIFLTEFEKGDALKCVGCDSRNNTDCASNPRKIKAKECHLYQPEKYNEPSNLMKLLSDVGKEFSNKNVSEWKCIKAVEKFNGTEIVARGCALINTECDTVEPKLDVCEFCKTDGCNSSSMFTYNLTTILLLLGITFYLKR